MNEPITVAGKQVQTWDTDRLASVLLDVVDPLPSEQLADLAAIGRKMRTKSDRDIERVLLLLREGAS